MDKYRENIKKNYEEKKIFLGEMITNVKTKALNMYDNIYNNISNKMKVSYTHDDLNKKEDMSMYEKNMKEYGIFLGNLVTNIIVDSVDGLYFIKDTTFNYIHPKKEEVNSVSE